MRLSYNPLTILNYLKQEWLYRQYLTNRDMALEFRKQYIPDGVGDGKVLDFGCGRGRHVAMLSQLGYDVVGVDIIRHEYWNSLPKAMMLNGDKVLWNLESNQFDLCICFQVLYLIDEDLAVAKKLHSVLKDGGWLVMQVANLNNLWTRRTGRYLNDCEKVCRYYTSYSLPRLLVESGFKVEHIWMEKYYSPYCVGFVNGTLGLLPHQVGEWLADKTPPAYRGLINVWARKV